MISPHPAGRPPVPNPRRRSGAIGMPTRGTTHPNRLRRVDRWTVARLGDVLRSAADPLVVDVGFGARPVTTVELFERLRAVRPDVEVLGLEIDSERVAAAASWARPGLRFARGGFELPVPDGRRPVLVRAFNVLRQYAEQEVAGAWQRLTARLAPGGFLVEGTCDEFGRRATWVAVGAEGPRTLTLAARLGSLEQPSVLAERLPKALIHRNVPGEPVHAFLQTLDRAWQAAAPLGVFGTRQRWIATVRQTAQEWPVVDGPLRWRVGEVTVAWAAVAPGALRAADRR